MKQRVITIAAGVLIALILIFYLTSFQVRITDKAVVTTFGRPIKTISKPGLYWKWPWPIQRVYKFDSRLQIFEGRFEETYTHDGKNIIIHASLGWRISDPLKFLERVGTVEEAERNLEGLVRNYQNGVIGRHPLSNFISPNPEEVKFDRIEEEILKPVQKEAFQRYGIQVELFAIKRLSLPMNTSQAVFARMRRERERIAKRYRAEGEAKAIEIKARAESLKDKTLAEAEAEAKRIRGEGDAEAAKYYKIFAKNEDLAIFLKELETLEETLKERATVILDTSTSPYNLFQSPPVTLIENNPESKGGLEKE